MLVHYCRISSRIHDMGSIRKNISTSKYALYDEYILSWYFIACGLWYQDDLGHWPCGLWSANASKITIRRIWIRLETDLWTVHIFRLLNQRQNVRTSEKFFYSKCMLKCLTLDISKYEYTRQRAHIFMNCMQFEDKHWSSCRTHSMHNFSINGVRGRIRLIIKDKQ